MTLLCKLCWRVTWSRTGVCPRCERGHQGVA